LSWHIRRSRVADKKHEVCEKDNCEPLNREPNNLSSYYIFTVSSCPSLIMKHKMLSAVLQTSIFTVVSLFIWAYPSCGPYFFPAYVLIFFAGDMLDYAGFQTVFIFFVSVAGFLIPLRPPVDWDRHFFTAVVMFEIIFVWTMASLISGARRKLERRMREAEIEIHDENKRIQELQRQIESYSKHKQGLVHQLKLQSEMSESVQMLSGIMNMDEIRGRLLRLLERYFPGAVCALVSGAARDDMESWVFQRKVPLLVMDAEQDARFNAMPGRNTGERSVMVLPLNVLQSHSGFIRVSSGQPRAFQMEDLRTADLLGMLAAISMESAYLFYKIQELAIHDGLTHLYTHRAFQQRLQDEVLRAGRSQMPFGMVMCDIDHFKRYNDTFGHQAGDFVLQAVSGVLTRTTRDVDFVARYGGEEFAIILPSMDMAQCVFVAENIRTVVGREPFVFEGKRTAVTLSVGVSVFPNDATTSSQLVRVADQRLYKAKEGGRNRVVSA